MAGKCTCGGELAGKEPEEALHSVPQGRRRQLTGSLCKQAENHVY